MLLVLKRRMLCVFWGVWGSCTCHIRFRIVAVSSIFLCMYTSLFYGSWIIHGLLSHSHLPVCQQGFQRWEQSPVSLAVQTVQHRDSCLQEQCTHGDRACTSVLMEVTSWSATGTGKEPGIGLLFTQVILLKKCIEIESQLQSQTMKFVGTMISYRLVSTCPKTVSCHSDCFFVRWNLILLLWYEHALEHETICQHAHDVQRQPSAVAPITLAQVHMLPIETPDGQEYFAISLCPHGVGTVATTWKVQGKGILTPVSHLLLRFWAQTWAEMPTWPAQGCEMSDQESCGTSSQHARIQSQSTCSGWAKGIHTVSLNWRVTHSGRQFLH